MAERFTHKEYVKWYEEREKLHLDLIRRREKLPNREEFYKEVKRRRIQSEELDANSLGRATESLPEKSGCELNLAQGANALTVTKQGAREAKNELGDEMKRATSWGSQEKVYSLEKKGSVRQSCTIEVIESDEDEAAQAEKRTLLIPDSLGLSMKMQNERGADAVLSVSSQPRQIVGCENGSPAGTEKITHQQNENEKENSSHTPEIGDHNQLRSWIAEINDENIISDKNVNVENERMFVVDDNWKEQESPRVVVQTNVCVNGIKSKALWDSGSTVTGISGSMAHLLKPEANSAIRDVVIVDANGGQTV